MSKPYAGYKGNPLANIKPKAVAFVDKGANGKKFFLFKSKGESTVNKETALKIIKAGTLSKAEAEALLLTVEKDGQVEVRKAIDAMEAPANTVDVEKMTDLLVEKIGAKISKENVDCLKGIHTSLQEVSKKLGDLIAMGTEAKPQPDKEVPPEDMKKYVEAIRKGDATVDVPDNCLKAVMAELAKA